MSYDRMIKVNGKVYGPYRYSSKRVNGKVQTKYVCKVPPKEQKALDAFLGTDVRVREVEITIKKSLKRRTFSEWLTDYFILPNRCPYWRVCKEYRDPSHTCNENEGYYGESLASCYVKDNPCYHIGLKEGATLQAEWERERVKKAIESMAIYGREDCINRKDLLKELGIEQEEKEK